MAQSVPDLVADVEAFHQRFAIAYDGPPRDLPTDLRDFRKLFLFEEAGEYSTARSRAKQFDALLDIVYVALGSAHLHGFDFYAGWQRIHAANMLKVKAQSPDDSLRNFVHDVVKPPNWVAPDLTDLV
jgi:predicted HAD superfamily Cof-like phosphohydrolase